MFPTSANPALRLRLIGDFDLTAGGESLSIRQCGQRLLAFLAIARGPVTRPLLAGSLWPDSSAARASANLRAAISRLPRPQGILLVRSQGTRASLSEDLSVDLYSANDLIQVPDTVTGAAPQTWRSDLLPQWEEDWALMERERYRQARLHALEQLSHRLRREGRFADAMQAALDALQGEPLRESAHRLVIEVHLAEGNAAEALGQYDRYRGLLRTELGIAPSPRLRHLVRPLLERPED